EADLNAADVAAFVPKDLAMVEMPRARAIFENQNSVMAAFPPILFPLGIRPALNDPEPTAIVERERDRLHDVRLPGKERHVKPVRQSHVLRRFRGGQRLALPPNGQRRIPAQRASKDQKEKQAVADAITASAHGAYRIAKRS